jgi:hypothetical protein
VLLIPQRAPRAAKGTMVDPYHLQMSGYRQFVYNLTGNVGTKSPNRPDDVALVQLGFRALARATSFLSGPEDEKIFSAVEWTGFCSGEEADPLVKAIRRFQSVAPNGVRDGHVSIFQEHEPMFHLGGTNKGVFILSDLMTAIIEVHADVWPNIHRIEGCPPVLRDKVAMIMSDTKRPALP